MCAFTTQGFLAWDICEGSITNIHVSDFISRNVAPKLTQASHLLLDNWSGHHHPAAFQTIARVSGGKFQFSVPYDHNSKPIERGINLVKSWLRDHDREHSIDPIATLNNAFFQFSVAGPQGHKAITLWNEYFRNYESFLNE